jgi:hypothetical protein
MRDRIRAVIAMLTPRREVLTDAKRSGVDRRATDRGTPDRRAVAPVTGEELKARLAELNG